MSAVPEGRYVTIFDDYRIHYHEYGDGPAVIFVHGSGPGASGWSNFRLNAPEIAAAGTRCLVPDMLGYGYSSITETPTFTYDDLVRGIVEFADAVGADQYVLVGNSMGGAVAISIALQFPERVRGLVLMAPGGLEDRETYMQMRGIRTMIRTLYSGEPLTRDAMRRIFELQLYDPSLITDELIEERFRIAERQPRGLFEKVVVPDQRDRLDQIQAPILGFWGVDDQFCPVSGAMTIATRCRRTRMTMLSECGHWVMVEYRDLFNRETIQYLQELG